jgi:hypothetical protein
VGGAPFDNAEVLRVTPGAEARLEEALLSGRRRDHGAARLPDGRVLLVGGLDAAGRPRADAELVTVEDGGTDVRAAPTAGRPQARARPTVLALDDGTVLVVGGQDGAGEPVAAVERFDPARETFEVTAAALPARRDAAWAALTGGRAVQVGGREADGSWSPRLELLLDGGARVVELPDDLVAPGGDGRPLEAPVAAGLPDGRVLVIGRDPRSGRAAARIVDPGGTRTAPEAARPPVDPSRVATHLVRLADGSFAEADGAGISLLRLDLATPFTDPAARIFPGQPNQQPELSLDGPGRWETAAGRLVARRDGARFDLPTARFAEVRVELEAEGPVELLLTAAGAPPAAVDVAPDRVAVGDACALERGDGPVVVRRAGGALTLERGGATARCDVDLAGRVGIAVRAARGSAVRQIAVARL